MYNSGISVLPLNLLEIEDNEDDEYYDYIQNGKTIDNKEEISNQFNSIFVNLGKNLGDKIPHNKQRISCDII